MQLLVGLPVLGQELVLQEQKPVLQRQEQVLELRGPVLQLQGQEPVQQLLELELGLREVMTQLPVEMQCMYLMKEQNKKSMKHRLKER